MNFSGDCAASRARLQQGQGMAEALIVSLALLTLVSAGVWLFQAHHLAVLAQHESSRVAFRATRYLSVIGQPGLYADQVVPALRLDKVAQARYALTQELGTDKRLVYRADARASVLKPFSENQRFTQLNQAPATLGDHLDIVRSTAILIDAGHASSDQLAQQRLADAPLVWANAANRSYSLSERIHHAVAGTDAAWSRPLAMSEWLSHWADVIPPDRLGPNHSGVAP